jgi:DNA repair protein RadA/Sms
MAKPPKKFVCSACGDVTNRWAGQCGKCSEWNTISEQAQSSVAPITAKLSQSSGGRIMQMNGLDTEVTLPDRIRTGIAELDSVLGGGLVERSVTLISGEPGIGKSTLLIQALAAIARILGKQGKTCAYVSGEEHEDQVRLRAQRLGLGDAPVRLGHETQLRDVLTTLAAMDPAVAIIDSIQTMVSDAVDGAPGSISQIKACSEALREFAKSREGGCALIIVGHVTKGGDLAGPRMLEHMVDTVLSFEGDRSHQFRILRAVKNRFGATDEIGVFEMGEMGLKEVSNPSSLFLIDRDQPVSGACVMPTVEGGRAILVEVQALVIRRADQGYPRRNCVGWDAKRLDMILAVLEARCGLPFGTADVYLNVAGNYRLDDSGADLAVALACVSAFSDKPLPVGLAVFGELALSGDIRPVPYMSLRIREAKRLGFSGAWVPKMPQDAPKTEMRLKEMKSLHDVVPDLLRNE